MSIRAVLKLHCPDTPGIVYAVTRALFEAGANIMDAQQHQEELGGHFFMRVRFELPDGKEDARSAIEQSVARVAEKHDMVTQLGWAERRKRMAIMVSKYDHCLYDLFLRRQYGELDVDIPLVVSNHPKLQSVAEKFETPFACVPVDKSDKPAAERRVLELFQARNVDFVVLARYMQILGPTLLSAFPDRIINVHHGFLPAFKGAKPYRQAYLRGVKLIGATSHYVSEELDDGPILEQETMRVDHTHSAKDMRVLGRDIEKKVLAMAVRAHVEERVMVYKRRTIMFR